MRWWLSICLILFVVLTGCSTGADNVSKDLQNMMKEVKSYRGEGTLSIMTSSQPQNIQVQISYLAPHYYRVELTNPEKEIKQVILKNDDGVFVISPHLNKSFRFQSDWPQNSGQIYLYQTILDSIVSDENRKMEKTEEGYSFEVSTKTPIHQNWTKQRVVLDQQYQPKQVDVFDENDKVVVSMKFSKFEGNAKLEKNQFASDRNLPKEKSTITQERDLKTVTPSYIPSGTKLYDSQTLTTEEGTTVLMRYDGKRKFTLSQKLPQTIETHLPLNSSIVNLDTTVAVTTDLHQSRKLTWLHDGVEFELVGNLSLDEMIKIANSTLMEPMK